MNLDISSYNSAQVGDYKNICELLRKEIDTALPDAEHKVWHGHPVWFIHGNPVVGYAKLKDCVQLLFWSGQSFDEKGLAPEGSFKAAQARYTNIDQINTSDLAQWLLKAREIQWDYQHIVKNRGVLKRLK